MPRVKVYTERKVSYHSKSQAKRLASACVKVNMDESVYIRKATDHCVKNDIIKPLNGD